MNCGKKMYILRGEIFFEIAGTERTIRERKVELATSQFPRVTGRGIRRLRKVGKIARTIANRARTEPTRARPGKSTRPGASREVRRNQKVREKRAADTIWARKARRVTNRRVTKVEAGRIATEFRVAAAAGRARVRVTIPRENERS